jgi:hypothetical protein
MTSGANSVNASVNVVRTSRATPAVGHAKLFDNLSIGQNLKLHVIRHLEQQRYEVEFGGRRHVVESRVSLEPGSQIEARVESKGERLELRYLASEAAQSSAAVPGDTKAPVLPADLGELAAQYRIPLDPQAGETIARAAAQVTNRELMMSGGLFLQKMNREVTPPDLAALYGAMSGEMQAVASLPRAAIELDVNRDVNELAESLADSLDAGARDALDARVAAVSDESNRHDGDGDSRRALRLLNLQDEGSVAWRYGTLPILVAGRLIELDLVMFREREQGATRGGLKRLLMTLETTHFGRVHVEARAIDNRLLVKLRAPTAAAVDAMSAYGEDVRAAIELLGWAVDDVSYEIVANAGCPARVIVDHVLSSGSMDREL